MRKSRISIFMIVVSIVAVLLFTFSTENTMAASKPKVIKLAHPLPDFDVMVQNIIKAADEFNAATNGEYKLEVYPGGVLAGMLEGFEMVQSGALEACDFAPDYLSEKDLIFGAQNLPFAFKGPVQFQKFLDMVREKEWDQRLKEKYNVKLLSLIVCFAHDAWCGTKPIKTLDDWKGKVVWASSPAEAEALKLLGASPVSMDWGEGYPAIEKGVVDGGTYGLGAAWMLKWSACKYFTAANMFSSSAGVAINQDVFNSMPKDIQDSLLKVFKEYQERMIPYFSHDVLKIMEDDLTARGAEVYHPPADEIAKWAKATRGAWDSYLGKLSPEQADMIKGLIETANK